MGEFLLDDVAVVVEGVEEVGDGGRGRRGILVVMPVGPAEVVVGDLIFDVDLRVGPFGDFGAEVGVIHQQV